MRKNTIIYPLIIALFIANQSCKKDTNITSSDPDTLSGKMASIDSTNIDTSLLCYLPFSGNLKDKSGHKNNGTLVGNLSYVSDRSGNPSKAASFSASNTYIEIPEADFVGVTRATIALQFYPTSSNQQELVSKMSYNVPIGSPGFYQSFSFVYNSNNNIAFDIRQEGSCDATVGTGWNIPLYSYTPVLLNTWNHVAITFSNNVQRIYLNGVLVGLETKTASPICAGGPIRLGVWWTGDPVFFTGNMDEVRLYNRVLSGKEIKALWSISNE